jgi:hypothetical protein
MGGSKKPDGHPLRLDESAAGASKDLPAFLARPRGAPAYPGFPILHDVEVDGFTLGMITDWEAERSEEGDAFVVAPDGSRAGLVWDVGDTTSLAGVLREPERHRWGVFAVTFRHVMTDRPSARRNLEEILPMLRPYWNEWRQAQGFSEEAPGAEDD